MHVAVIVNPLRRESTAAASGLVARVRTRGWPEPLVLETTVADPGTGQARQALAAGVERVVVCGGDGTVRAVAAVVASAPPDGPGPHGTGAPTTSPHHAGPAAPRPSLGVVATGTANLFARNVGLPLGRASTLERSIARLPRRHGSTAAMPSAGPATRALAGAAVETALGHRVRHVDLGRARLQTGGRTELHDFLVVAGIGHDAATVAETSPALKRSISWGAYFQPAVARLARRGHDVLLELDGERALATSAWTVLGGIGGRIPLGITIFPDAAIDDGLLEVAVVAPRTPLHWAPVATRVLLRRGPGAGSLRYLRGRSLRVTTHTPLPVQLDGDPYPAVDVLELSLRQHALPVAVG